MDIVEPQPSSSAPANDLQAKDEGLQQTVNTMLVLLVVVSGTLTIFLVRQWRFAKTDLDTLRPQAAQIISDYNRLSAPAMQEFLRKLTDYSKTHPDFAPIAAKYHLNDSAVKPASGPVTASPAPASSVSKP
jgi:hypothetical protein